MEQKKVKALFFDIDGTLISSVTHQIHPRDLLSLQIMKDKGYLLFVATGRDLTIPEEAEILDPLQPYFTGFIDVNGQRCTLTDGTQISFHPLADEDFLPIRAACEKHHLSMLYRRGNTNYLSELTDHVIRYWSSWMDLDIPEIRPMDPDIHDIPKLCIHCSPEEEAEFLTPLMHRTWTARITPDLIDLIPNGVGKDSGIRDICGYFGIPIEQTMGFGDGQNDLGMLQAAGISVAMGNAAENVKAAADFITYTADDAGITHALKHYGVI